MKALRIVLLLLALLLPAMAAQAHPKLTLTEAIPADDPPHHHHHCVLDRYGSLIDVEYRHGLTPDDIDSAFLFHEHLANGHSQHWAWNPSAVYITLYQNVGVSRFPIASAYCT